MVVTYAIPVLFLFVLLEYRLLQVAQAWTLSRHRHTGQPIGWHPIAADYSFYKSHLGRGVCAGLRAFACVHDL